MAISRTPTLAEVLNAVKTLTAKGIRVAWPGQVQKYNPSTQLADVQPLIADVIEDPDGNLSNVSLPVVTNCPVSWASGGGFFIACPLQIGDTGTLLIMDRTIDAWLAQGGAQSPADQRRHNLSDSIFIPGIHDNQHALQGVDGSVISLGQNGALADFVALSSKVHSALTTLYNAISAAPVVAGDGGASFKAAILAALVGWPPSVASGTVKVLG